MKRARGRVALALLARVLGAAPGRRGAPVVGAQFRYWAFTNHNDTARRASLY